MTKTKADVKTKTILVVEDSPESRQMYADALEAAGYRVLQAEDGAVGVRLATQAETPPDLVLMNVSMPLVSGVDAVEILKGHPVTEHVPILVVTGHAGPSVRDGAWEAGCDDFLSKPVSPAELVDAVADCLAHAPPRPAPDSAAEVERKQQQQLRSRKGRQGAS